MLRETDRDALYYAPVYYTTRARDTYDAPFEVCCNHEHATPLAAEECSPLEYVLDRIPSGYPPMGVKAWTGRHWRPLTAEEERSIPPLPDGIPSMARKVGATMEALYYAPAYWITGERHGIGAPFDICCPHEHPTALDAAECPPREYVIDVPSGCPPMEVLAWTGETLAATHLPGEPSATRTVRPRTVHVSSAHPLHGSAVASSLTQFQR